LSGSTPVCHNPGHRGGHTKKKTKGKRENGKLGNGKCHPSEKTNFCNWGKTKRERLSWGRKKVVRGKGMNEKYEKKKVQLIAGGGSTKKSSSGEEGGT